MSRALRLTQCLGLGPACAGRALVCDAATGRYELAEAVNVDVAGGRIRRRPGLVRIGETGFDALFSDGPNLYGVAGGGLFLVPGQGAPRFLRDGLAPGAAMAFLAVGGTVYFANGSESGRIRDGVAAPWRGERYPGPDRTARYGPPPAGHLLAGHAGRIWIARESLVHFTEGAGLFDWVDGLGGFLPPAVGRVRLLAPIAGGLLIGDEAGVVFAAGADPKTMTFARVCPDPPIPGSEVRLPAGGREVVAGREIAGDAAIWAGRGGIYLGLPGGRVIRLLRLAMPPALRAAAVVTGGRYLLFCNDGA